jgi:hypothetical protein
MALAPNDPGELNFVLPYESTFSETQTMHASMI